MTTDLDDTDSCSSRSRFGTTRNFHFNSFESLYGDIQDVTSCGRDAVQSTLELKEYLSHYDSAIRITAGLNLSRVINTAITPLASEIGGPPSRSFAAGRIFEEHLESVLSRLNIFDGRLCRVRSFWTYAGLGLSATTAVFVVQQNWRLAVLSLGIRVLVSALIGRDGNLPFESKRMHEDSPLQLLLRCVLSHFGDSLIFLGLSLSLALHQRIVWASAIGATGAIMFLATLLRVAALQIGVQLYRLDAERLLRNSFLLAGFVLAAVFQPSIPSAGTPLVAVAALGGLIYSLCEFYRCVVHIRFQQADFDHRPPEVTILVGNGEYASQAIRPGPRWGEPTEVAA